MSEQIIGQIAEYLNSLLPGEGLELFDVQYRREGHGWVLRVFIDSTTGVTLDDCSRVSRELGQYLDVEDLIEHAYHLEVSSPGLERPLRGIEDFRRFTGKKARVKFHDPLSGTKTFEGLIEAVTGENIVMRVAEDKELQFTLDKVNKARLAI